MASTKQLHIEWSATNSSIFNENTFVLLHVVKICCCRHLLLYAFVCWSLVRKDVIKANLHGLLFTQTMHDVEGERLAVAFKLRSPDTALLDFHTALIAAGKQVEPR